MSSTGILQNLAVHGYKAGDHFRPIVRGSRLSRCLAHRAAMTAVGGKMAERLREGRRIARGNDVAIRAVIHQVDESLGASSDRIWSPVSSDRIPHAVDRIPPTLIEKPQSQVVKADARAMASL